MTFYYDNVFVGNTSVVGGPYEQKGLLKDKFDLYYDDFRIGEKSFEKAEVKMLKDCINILLKKINKEDRNIDVLISGDLLNQISISSYAAREFKIPFLGIYGACSSSVEGMIILSSLIDSNKVKNGIVSVSSHNLSSEKQFRNPVEYGGNLKPKYSTFTSTGGASIYLTKEKTKVKVVSSTIGRVIDLKECDPFNMGSAMAGSCCDTLYEHLKQTKTTINDYDLILSGDLGKYGEKILIDYMREKYNIELSNKYRDSGTMIYSEEQKETNAGASGPLTIAMVSFSSIIPLLKKGIYKRVLLIATGALFSPTFIYQKESIPSISHAICLESVL